MVPFATRIAQGLTDNADAISEAHLALCQAALSCHYTDPIDREKWIMGYVYNKVLLHLRKEKPKKETKMRLTYTPFRPLTVHDVIARLPERLQAVALARWVDRHRRTPWVTVAQGLGISVPFAKSLLKEARTLAVGILNDEATSELPPTNKRPTEK